MRKSKILTALVFLFSCDATYDRGIVVESNALQKNQVEAEELARNWVSSNLSVALVGVHTNVYWVTTRCTENANKTSVLWDGHCWEGYMFTCDEIYVAQREFLSESAFVHELIHCYQLAVLGDLDAEHVNTTWWDLAKPINEALKRREW